MGKPFMGAKRCGPRRLLISTKTRPGVPGNEELVPCNRTSQHNNSAPKGWHNLAHGG